MKKIIISNNHKKIEKALSRFGGYATVEAEYGNLVIKGNMGTLAHHAGAYKGGLCPCLYENDNFNHFHDDDVEVIGVSHFDLDTLGGVLALQRIKPDAPEFWRVAAHVDIDGAHRLNDANPSKKTIDRLNAFWAWSESNRLFAPRDGSVADVTEFFDKAYKILTLILSGEPELIQAGREWFEKKESLEKESFRELIGGCILRESDMFVNTLYSHNSCLYSAVVALNAKTKAVTLSFADGGKESNACEIMQEIFGEKAGGHAGIAGTPRDGEYTIDDARKVALCIKQKKG